MIYYYAINEQNADARHKCRVLPDDIAATDIAICCAEDWWGDTGWEWPPYAWPVTVAIYRTRHQQEPDAKVSVGMSIEPSFFAREIPQ